MARISVSAPNPYNGGSRLRDYTALKISLISQIDDSGRNGQLRGNNTRNDPPDSRVMGCLYGPLTVTSRSAFCTETSNVCPCDIKCII